MNLRFPMDARPDAVWDALADFGNMAAWSPDLASSRLVEGNGLEKGALRELVFKQPQNGIERIREKIDMVGDRVFGYYLPGGIGPYGRAGSAWAVIPHGAGSMVEVISYVADGPWWAMMMRPLVHRQLKAGVKRALGNLDRQLALPGRNSAP